MGVLTGTPIHSIEEGKKEYGEEALRQGIRNFLAGFRNGQMFAGEIDFLSRLQAQIDPAEVTGVAVLAFALSCLATLYPAWQAARLDPVEALRYE